MVNRFALDAKTTEESFHSRGQPACSNIELDPLVPCYAYDTHVQTTVYYRSRGNSVPIRRH